MLLHNQLQHNSTGLMADVYMNRGMIESSSLDSIVSQLPDTYYNDIVLKRHITDNYTIDSDADDIDVESHDGNQRIIHFTSRLSEYSAILLICVAQLLTQSTLAQSILIPYYIGNTFNTSDIGELSWMGAAYGIGAGTFIIIAGRLGDTYGYKLILCTGYIIYCISTIICGLLSYSKIIILFDVFRAIQGIGVAFAVPNALGLLGVMYSQGKQRNFVFSIYAAVAPLGLLSGAVITALFATYIQWQYTYYITGVIVGIVSLLSIYIIPNIKHKHREEQIFDVYGALCGVSSLVCIAFTINQAGIAGWNTAYTYILLIAGVVLLGIFVYCEQYIAKQPLVPFQVFTRDVIGMCTHCIVLNCMCVLV